MQVVNANITSFEDILRLVSTANKFDEKIDVIGDGNLTVSAKSLIGVAAASHKRQLMLVIHSDDSRIGDKLSCVCG